MLFRLFQLRFRQRPLDGGIGADLVRRFWRRPASRRHRASFCASISGRDLDGTGYLFLKLRLGHGGGLARPIGEVLVDALIGERWQFILKT
jgi:hypothetical protein